jgi:hypothetical protein
VRNALPVSQKSFPARTQNTVNSGQRRMLPADYPQYRIVRSYSDMWSAEREDGTTLLAAVLQKMSGNGAER